MIIHSDNLMFPVTRQVSANPRYYQVLRTFIIRTGGTVTVILPGFVYDCTSNIRALWWFDSPGAGSDTVANLHHDAWYACHYPTEGKREIADHYFYRLMRHYGAGRIKASIKYGIVRSPAGRRAWNAKSLPSIDYNRLLIRLAAENDTEHIETLSRRGSAMAELLQAADRNPVHSEREFIKQEMLSVASGDIDDALKG